MKNEQLLNDLHKAYDELIASIHNFREQALNVRRMQFDLENKKLEAYADGLIIGKNQIERDASEYDLFGVEVEKLQDEQLVEAELYAVKEVKETRVEYLRSVIRVLELSQVDE